LHTGSGSETIPDTGIPEAPTDSVLYGRKNAAWEAIPAASEIGSILATYANFTALIAGQGSQITNYIYEITNGYGFQGITNKKVWARYLGTNVGNITDYSISDIFEPNVWRPRLLSTNTSTENAALINNAITAAAGAVITAGSFVIGVRYWIVEVGTTDFTLIGAGSNSQRVNFVATGVGTGTGTASELVNGSVILPAGDFFTRKINWNPQVNLKGAGKRATTLRATHAEAMIEYTGFYWYEISGAIEEMTLLGANLATNAINIESTTYFNIRNINIKSISGYGINLAGCLTGMFESIHVHSCNGGVKGIRDNSTSIGALPCNLLQFKSCTFQDIPTWAANFDYASQISFIDGCNFERCGTNGDAATGIIKITNACPINEEIGLIINNAWAEINQGTLISVQGIYPLTKHIIKNSMFKFGNGINGIDIVSGSVILEDSVVDFPVNITAGSITKRNSTTGAVTLAANTKNLDYTVKEFTGTLLDLANPHGNNYNFTTPSNSLTYTLTNNTVNNAFVTCRINASTEPAVTGATKITGSTFVISTDMEMIVERRNGIARYFFLEL
jgi:hypothetical protein